MNDSYYKVVTGRIFYSLVFISFFSSLLVAEPQFAAFKGVSCQTCHVSSYGGGARRAKEGSWQWMTSRMLIGGNFRFLGLIDKRPLGERRLLFPMEGALHLNVEVTDNISFAASNDFGALRELYAYLHDLKKLPVQVKAGVFPLPYGLNIADHTSFIKEGRIKNNNPAQGSQEVGLGAGRFGARYRDAGLQVSYDKDSLFFGHFAFTNGLKGLESRPFPGNQNNRGSAFTVTEGLRWGHLTLGFSLFQGRSYDPANQWSLEESRTSGFGIFGLGPVAFLGEYGFGRNYNNTTKIKTADLAAFYGEVVWDMPRPWVSFWAQRAFLKVREEFLDQDRRLSDNTLERRQVSLDSVIFPHLSLEAIYRNNRERPEVFNDDLMLMAHVFF